MQEKIIRFNLTQEMSIELLKFNELKKEINILKQIEDKNESVLLLIKSKEEELKKCRENFIRDFRMNNKKEIIEYLQTKDWNFNLF